MSLLDKQIVAVLDRLHVEQIGRTQRGHGLPPCRWEYLPTVDVYRCCHMTILGRTVVDQQR
jgi:hypothetical protein